MLTRLPVLGLEHESFCHRRHQAGHQANQFPLPVLSLDSANRKVLKLRQGEDLPKSGLH